MNGPGCIGALLGLGVLSMPLDAALIEEREAVGSVLRFVATHESDAGGCHGNEEVGG
jgi:hypothetical protein